jgi:photosystem II stability/assembly factor-like uncharacterized protein
VRHPRARRFGGVLARVLGSALLAGCGHTALSGENQASASLSIQQVNPGVHIREAHLLNPTFGWLLTTDRLLTSTDGGINWADVTPPSNARTPLETAFFLNPSHGWAVVRSSQLNLASDSAPLDLFTTADGGRHWSAHHMTITIALDTPGPVYLTFIDTMKGWLVVDHGSHAGFMYYTGWRTADGGQTWTTVSFPQSAPVLFINERDGFSTDGANGPRSATYATHDGGMTWALLTVPLVGGSAVSPAFQMPVFSDDRNGVLAGAVADPSGGTASEVFYTTSDAGRSWSPAATVPNPDPQSSAQLAGVVNGKVWLAAFLRRGPIAGNTYTRLKTTQDGGRSWEWMPPMFAGGFNMREISFASSTGWAIVIDAGCLGFKTTCFEDSGLFQTVDAGAHWLEVSVT